MPGAALTVLVLRPSTELEPAECIRVYFNSYISHEGQFFFNPFNVKVNIKSSRFKLCVLLSCAFYVLVDAFMTIRLFTCNVCFTYFTYYMYTVVGTVESLVVLSPNIIFICSSSCLKFIWSTNANLLLQVKFILKNNYYLLREIKYKFFYKKLVVILQLLVYQTFDCIFSINN